MECLVGTVQKSGSIFVFKFKILRGNGYLRLGLYNYLKRNRMFSGQGGGACIKVLTKNGAKIFKIDIQLQAIFLRDVSIYLLKKYFQCLFKRPILIYVTINKLKKPLYLCATTT